MLNLPKIHYFIDRMEFSCSSKSVRPERISGHNESWKSTVIYQLRGQILEKRPDFMGTTGNENRTGRPGHRQFSPPQAITVPASGF